MLSVSSEILQKFSGLVLSIDCYTESCRKPAGRKADALKSTQDELYRFAKEHEALVYTVCLQLLQEPAAARRAAGQALCFAVRHRKECPPGSLRAWLCRIAVHFAKSAAPRAR